VLSPSTAGTTPSTTTRGKTFGLQLTAHAPRSEGHDLIAASLGYLGGPEREDYVVVACDAGNHFDVSSPTACSPGTGNGITNGTIGRSSSDSKGWRHFVDLVLTSDPIDDLHLVANADFGVEQVRHTGDLAAQAQFSSQQWFGGMLAARYLLGRSFAVGGRGEYYRDRNGLTVGSSYIDRAAQTVFIAAPHSTTITTGTLTLDYLPTKNLMLRLDNRVDHADYRIFAKGVHTLTGNLVTTTLGVVVTTN